MSLISEALRKARQEAARREARARGEAPPPMAPGRTGHGRTGAVLLAGGVIGLAAAIAGGGAVWWALSRDGRPQPAAGGPLPAVATVPPPAPTAEPDPRRSRSPGPGSPAPTRTRPAAPAAAVPTVAAPTATAPATSVAAVPATPDPWPTASAQNTAAEPEPQVERQFVLEADLGYARLSLGYVIDRADDPFAEVNGREVHVGSVVDGFVVEAITRNEVRLRDARGPVVLRVR